MCALYRSLTKSRALSWLLPAGTLGGFVDSMILQPCSLVPGNPYPHVTDHTHPAHPLHASCDAARSSWTSFPNTPFLHRYREALPAVPQHFLCTSCKQPSEAHTLQPKERRLCFCVVSLCQASDLHARNIASIHNRGPNWRIQCVPAFRSVGGKSARYKTLERPTLVLAMKEVTVISISIAI